jgi:hypothetical protein
VSLRAQYCAAQPFAEFLRRAEVNADLWQALTRRAHVPHPAVERVRALGGRWRLLVLADDWCGDATNTLPVLAKLADLAENLDLRVLARDADADLMDAHLSPRGARAIPVVIALDADFVERGVLGSRHLPLQRWVDLVGAAMPKEARCREVRRRYAQERGVTTLDEVIGLLEHAASQRSAA